MTEYRKEKLIKLGAEALAEALLDLSVHSGKADEMIERLISTPDDNVAKFKKKLAALKRSKRFIGWREVSDFATELELLLQNLKAGVTDPLLGVKLVAKFFEADDAIYKRCEDSSGIIKDVFSFTAKSLFVDYASRCIDKQKVADIIIKICSNDGYGVRYVLIETAGKYLPEAIIRSMITTIQKKANDETNEYEKRHYFSLIESLARQIKDAELFEKTRIASWEEPTTAGIIDTARVYLESGDIEKAHSWLKKIAESEKFMEKEKDALLKEIYINQGNTDKLTELLFKRFRNSPGIRTLNEYLSVIGNEKREQVITEEIIEIRNDASLKHSDAEFLINVGKIDEAEEYILKWADQLNGRLYDSLLSFANVMETENRYLAASMIYRSLLISILDRAYNKAYSHGARYLRKLEKLAINIADWKGIKNQDEFKEQLIQAHGHKRSFWSKNEK
jgi:uncharacterized protein DUF6880